MYSENSKTSLVAVGDGLYSMKTKNEICKYDIKASRWTSWTNLALDGKGTAISPTEITLEFTVSEWTLLEGSILSDEPNLIAVGIGTDVSSCDTIFWEYSSPSNYYIAPRFDAQISSRGSYHQPIQPNLMFFGLASPTRGVLRVVGQSNYSIPIGIQRIGVVSNNGEISWDQQDLVPATNFVPKQRQWATSFLCGSNFVLVGDRSSEGFVFNIDHRIWMTITFEKTFYGHTVGNCFHYDGRNFVYGARRNGTEDRCLYELDVDEGRWICWGDNCSSSSEYPLILEMVIQQLPAIGVEKFRSRKGADIFFLVESQNVRAHQNFVISRCPYIGDLIDKNRNKSKPTEPIVLPDFTFDSFSGFLEYQYTDQIRLGSSFSIDLAKKCLEDAHRMHYDEYARCCIEWTVRYIKDSQFPDYFHLLQKLDDRENSYVQQYWKSAKKLYSNKPSISGSTLVPRPCYPDGASVTEEQRLGIEWQLNVPYFVLSSTLECVHTEGFEIPSDIHKLTTDWCEVNDAKLKELGVWSATNIAQSCNGDATQFWGDVLRLANVAKIRKVKRTAEFLLSKREALLSWDADRHEICRMLGYAHEGRSFKLWYNIAPLIHIDRNRINSEHITNLEVSHPHAVHCLMKCGWDLDNHH